MLFLQSCSAGDGKLPWVPRAEMGEAAAVVLMTLGHQHKTYAITAETAYSFEDIAGMLSAITGKEVKYLKPDLTAFTGALVKAAFQKKSFHS
jgi:NAD(P)H dehydrogenase (quinone)